MWQYFQVHNLCHHLSEVSEVNPCILTFVLTIPFLYSDKLRASRTAISAADVSNEHTLGVPGEAFKFSQCHNKVIVGESSGLKGEIAELEEFIRENVKP